MECRKRSLERKYGPEFVAATMGGGIPCPVCNVVHTASEDRKINIVKGDGEDAD